MSDFRERAAREFRQNMFSESELLYRSGCIDFQRIDEMLSAFAESQIAELTRQREEYKRDWEHTDACWKESCVRAKKAEAELEQAREALREWRSCCNTDNNRVDIDKILRLSRKENKDASC